MRPISWVGVLLLVIGAVLLSGRFSYTRDSETVSVGPVDIVAKRKSQIPPVYGVILIVAGGAALVTGARRRS